MQTKTLLRCVAGALVSSLLVGCSTKTNTIPPLYCYHESYQDSMYSYLKGETDLAKQIELMDEYFQAANQTQRPPAPGSYAHMGVLQSRMGNRAEAEKFLLLEKEHFPESADYIDFLLNQGKKIEGKKKGAKK